MAAHILRPFLLRPQTIGLSLGLGLSLTSYQQFVLSSPIKLDSSSSSPTISLSSYRAQARTPVVTRAGRLNPQAVRQISSGSVIGLCAGILVSTFSRPLALLLGLMVVGVQWASSYGINILPYDRIQRYVTKIDLRSSVQDNVAFKLSFGMTFALAAFMHF